MAEGRTGVVREPASLSLSVVLPFPCGWRLTSASVVSSKEHWIMKHELHIQLSCHVFLKTHDRILANCWCLIFRMMGIGSDSFFFSSLFFFIAVQLQLSAFSPLLWLLFAASNLWSGKAHSSGQLYSLLKETESPAYPVSWDHGVHLGWGSVLLHEVSSVWHFWATGIALQSYIISWN